jgi:hypothetical protein
MAVILQWVSGECRLMVLENMMLRNIFRPKRNEVAQGGESYITRSFINYTLCQV